MRQTTRLSQARTILHHAPDLADSVLKGSISLDNAYEEARIRKGRADTHVSRFNALKAAAPDLANMVVDGPLNLAEAEAALRERLERIYHNKFLLAAALHDQALEIFARHARVLLDAIREVKNVE